MNGQSETGRSWSPGDRVEVVADVRDVFFRSMRGWTGVVLDRPATVLSRPLFVCFDARCTMRDVKDHDRWCSACATFDADELRAAPGVEAAPADGTSGQL